MVNKVRIIVKDRFSIKERFRIRVWISVRRIRMITQN
jgi:hypothetical protein